MQEQPALTVSHEQVRAFRLASQHLATRLPAGSLLEAAGVCGLQNTAPDAAALALHARVAGLAAGDVERALANEKTLLQAWSVRAAMVVFPARDVAVFTRGLLPEDEADLRAFVPGAETGLERTGMSATELVDRTADALPGVLRGRALTKNELGVALAERIGWDMAGSARDVWLSPTYLAAEQSLGETLVRFALPITSLRGLLCYGAHRGQESPLVLAEDWLGAPLPAVDPNQARAELVRRYLHAYGPSTLDHFAAWAGIAPAQAARAWALVTGELAAVACAGREARVLRRDLPALMSSPAPAGIRFLPPYDPYVQLRDRETLVPDRAQQRRIWRLAGNPGIVLAEGLPVATWRSRKKGTRLQLTVEPIAPLTPGTRLEIEAEAATLAPFKECASTVVEFVAPLVTTQTEG